MAMAPAEASTGSAAKKAGRSSLLIALSVAAANALSTRAHANSNNGIRRPSFARCGRDPSSLAAPVLPSRRRSVLGMANDDSDEMNSETSTVQKDMNPFARASWYAAEAFGKMFAPDSASGDAPRTSSSAASGNEVDLSRSPRSLSEAQKRIELDNARSYFLSGEVDELAYDPDCVFSDPFVSFSGRDRFIENLSNLGSFITEYDAKMLEYRVDDAGTEVNTKVMVKLELNLPWKPVLAWPWGVTYRLDPESYLITSHGESWDIEPWEGVKQIFRKPTVKISKK